MSKQKHEIEEEVQKTLHFLDEKGELPPDPYFFTRLQQRLEERHREKLTFQTVLKPAFFILLFLANLGTVVWQYTNINEAAEKVRREKLVEVFVQQSNDISTGTNILNLE